MHVRVGAKVGWGSKVAFAELIVVQLRARSDNRARACSYVVLELARSDRLYRCAAVENACRTVRSAHARALWASIPTAMLAMPNAAAAGTSVTSIVDVASSRSGQPTATRGTAHQRPQRRPTRITVGIIRSSMRTRVA